MLFREFIKLTHEQQIIKFEELKRRILCQE